ncbi:MAG: trypsin-like peptidase domain-containing protein [Patescibacteria group bacterium]
MSAPNQFNQPHQAATVAAAILLAIVFGFVSGALGAHSKSLMVEAFGLVFGEKFLETSVDTNAEAQATASSIQANRQSEEELRIAAVEQAAPAVVSVVVTKDVPVFEQYYTNPFGNSFFNDFFGSLDFGVPQLRQKGTERQEVGAGTGFIVSADGLIVTNKHVVADEAAEYTVITTDGEKHTAQVLGRDPANDLAVLKIEVAADVELPIIVLSAEDPRVGQDVIAIGYALGEFTNSVSTGIVSGLSRDIVAGDSRGNSEQLYDVIQTDAAINPGNSGGPLLNSHGEAIGVNVAVDQGAQGIGFALPIADVRRVVESVQETGRISRPFLGVRYVMINEDMAAANQLPVNYGALVVRGERQVDLAVTPGSPADLAGIVENDIILEINGVRLTEDNPLMRAVRNLRAGDTVTLKILHKGEEQEVPLTLVEKE